MPKVLSSIWTSIIEYETPRLVRIHNRKLGLVRRLIQFSIVCYVLLYALWLQKGYQEFTRVESSVTVKIKGVTKSELGNGTNLDQCKKPLISSKYLVKFSINNSQEAKMTIYMIIGKPQLGILWPRDSLGFKRLCGNSSWNYLIYSR